MKLTTAAGEFEQTVQSPAWRAHSPNWAAIEDKFDKVSRPTLHPADADRLQAAIARLNEGELAPILSELGRAIQKPMPREAKLASRRVSVGAGRRQAHYAMKEDDTKATGTQLLDRSVGILNHLGEVGRGGARVSEIAETFGLNISTAHRIITSLERHRFVERDRELKRYRLGLALFALGAKAADTTGLRRVSHPCTHASRLTDRRHRFPDGAQRI